LQNNKPLWLAAATVAVKMGKVIRFDNGMIMPDFYNPEATFPRIAFVNSVVVRSEKR